MTRIAREQTMKRLQKQIAAMHPLALHLTSDEFSTADRRKFLEGVPFWMMFELSDAFNRLCADDRRDLKVKKATSKRKRTLAK